jgi:hypothetical protein
MVLKQVLGNPPPSDGLMKRKMGERMRRTTLTIMALILKNNILRLIWERFGCALFFPERFSVSEISEKWRRLERGLVIYPIRRGTVELLCPRLWSGRKGDMRRVLRRKSLNYRWCVSTTSHTCVEFRILWRGHGGSAKYTPRLYYSLDKASSWGWTRVPWLDIYWLLRTL